MVLSQKCCFVFLSLSHIFTQREAFITSVLLSCDAELVSLLQTISKKQLSCFVMFALLDSVGEVIDVQP